MRAGISLVLLAGALAAQTTDADSKGTIRGAVTDTSGAPVAGITVEAFSGVEARSATMGDGIIRVGGKTTANVTDDAGKYSVLDLTPGTYFVRTERDSGSSYKQVKVEAGQEATLDFVVSAKLSISGRVFDRNEDPVIDGFVWLIEPEYQSGVLKEMVVGPKVTNEDGSYSFDSGLEANRRYYIFVDRDLPTELAAAETPVLKDREPVEVPTYYPSAIRIDSVDPVILRPGEQRDKVDIKVAAAPFYCVDGKMQPGADFVVQESALAGTRLARLRASAAADGKYHFCGLSPAQYRISTDTASTEFAILGSDMQHVDLSAEAAHLRIKVDWDEPPSPPELPKLDARAAATLRKIAAAAGMGDTLSDDDLDVFAARFRQGDKPGNDDLRNAVSKMIPDEYFRVEFTHLLGELGIGPPSQMFAILTSAAGNQLKPISLIVPSDFPLPESIPSGTYTVGFQVFGNRVAYAKEVTFNDVKPNDGILRIAPASSGTLHIVVGSDMATLNVAVNDHEGKPVPYTTVMLIPDSVTSPATLARNAIHGIADQNGVYSSPSLPPGKYRVLATNSTVRWGVPEDLEKVMLVLFQATDVEAAAKSTTKIALEPVPIY